nr:LLM class flavin-dependent oxidoreductase [Mobilicoccus pelagius]
MRLSLLDFASKHDGQTAAEALAASVALAQRAEASGRFERIWYTEHHNMPSIVSSSPAVLIAHVAANTSAIRLGAGGVMLPNHSPLVIAEQFGTLAELHPGRIDLGLGRAPGTDQVTWRALRRDPRASDQFPEDVEELRGYLAGESLVHTVDAYPGSGTRVPLYILGSSMFGARLAARLGLPYSFASHFSPAALQPAVAAYRAEYTPSEDFPTPYVIAGANAVAGTTLEDARRRHETVLRGRVTSMVRQNPQFRGRELTEADVDALMTSPLADQARTMLMYTAVGTTDDLRTYLEDFAQKADADEIMVALHGSTTEEQMTTLDALAAV